MLPSLLIVLGAAAATTWAHTCPVADTSIVAHSGTPVGKIEAHNGFDMYISKPEGNATKAVLYLTDVFGIQLAENKLHVPPPAPCTTNLADSFARAGFLTVAPDLFNGTPAPGDINVPGFNTTAFLNDHGPAQTDPIVAAGLAYIRSLGITRVGATGYCFGGRYAFRAGSNLTTTSIRPGQGARAVFAAHPSMLGDEEIAAIQGPASVAAAETDALMPAARRTEITALLQNSGQEYSFAVYGGTSHGFGVRVNVTDPRQKFAKEEAFLQAARWFSVWL
ncbi:dienelactone hydrolase family protein [Sporothrix schenckii 1099-18]|uniref:Dienelactone hydrolase family protein n=1 Tax=Sporothrix schenckii 1099-18 TaxID=1397361 RepID=A0A0F2M7W4_SPOSC|nr:dienelactone hydrolase family protein [Sporothrix schenckii 1099-18]KJR84266.1 dienelactone hydrolase family protein [Sporothrix schenckii 1099-18]